MASTNQVVLVGRVGQDPELRHTQTGKAVVNFSLATTAPNADKTTEWHRIVAWEKQADNVARYVKQGNLVAVTGRLTYRDWEKDGVKRQSAEIVASHVDFLTPKGEGEGARPPAHGERPAPAFPQAQPKAQPFAQRGPALPDDEIPF